MGLVADIITTKLALQGVTFSWHLAGRETYVTVKKTRKPPAKAAFKDPTVRELVAAAKESAPVIGIGSAGRIVTVDLDDQSPHILVNAGVAGGVGDPFGDDQLAAAFAGWQGQDSCVWAGGGIASSSITPAVRGTNRRPGSSGETDRCDSGRFALL
ncbi:hypothetical protein ACFYWU_34570 [Streptomyces chrestomyceticus]|uniref:hypothetical protein n=1 Tax=Streptomyces chrestomyceticus TaxID=68185 RepID=UPI0036BF4078